jgi:pimeloyl-ACP methyl ester carboxylesterase
VKTLGGEYVPVDGTRIRYLSRGCGPPVLLIHGLGQSLEVWWFNIGPLSEHYRVYAMDLPGHGFSDKPAVDYTLSLFAKYVVGFMDALDIRRASLVGHSLGGGISMGMAVSQPDRVDKIVLVDSGSLSGKIPLGYRLCMLPVVGDILVRPTIKSEVRRRTKKAFYNPDLLTDDMVDLNCRLLRIPGVKDTMLSLIRNAGGLKVKNAEVAISDNLCTIKAPTLLIHGAQDRAVPLDSARNACQLIPDSRLEIIEECGHCPHLEKPSKFNRAVESFLGS